MKLSGAISFAALLLFLPVSHALTVEEETLEKTYVEPIKNGLASTFGEVPLAIAGGIASGLLLFGIWKVRRDHRMSVLIVLLSLATSRQPVAACANIENSTLESSYLKYIEDTQWFSQPVERALAARPEDDPHVTPNPSAYRYEPAPGIRQNDEAIRLILRGKAPEALALLEKVEAEHPGLYATAANLGTCFELLGEDEKALKWINEGLDRNPDSHMLAEWLHVRVLEAKIALKADPSWLETHTISGLNPEHGTFETSQGIKDAEGILTSFRSQCTVRSLFIKPRDPVMAQLLYEAATFMLSKRANSVKSTLALAITYGLDEGRAAKLQMEADKIILETPRLSQPGGFGVWMVKWKVPLIFLQCMFLAFVIPMTYVLKKQSSES
jgi:tetratricopeptide (TPR) repeat protein